jgi:hypothetical protein
MSQPVYVSALHRGEQKPFTAEIAENIRRGRGEKPFLQLSLRSLRMFSASSAVRSFYTVNLLGTVMVVVHHALDPIFQQHDVKVNQQANRKIQQSQM